MDLKLKCFVKSREMNPEIDTSCENSILKTDEKVFGLIYEIANISTGTKYIGQTVSHRKNKDRWRPFGIQGRFNDHVSEAINNTKRKQCSYLNNAIRKHGKENFTVNLITVCSKATLDDMEQKFISERNTLFPIGYNLTKGGKSTFVASQFDSTTLCETKKRGGCTYRSETTRSKMSQRAKELLCEGIKTERARNAINHHRVHKLSRFKGQTIDMSKLDSYIRKKGDAVVVKVGDSTASFRSKLDTHEQKIDKAKAFLKEVHDATLSNCGEPVKPE